MNTAARNAIALLVIAGSVASRITECATVRVSGAGELQSKTDALKAGDTLVVQAGTYDVSTWNITNLSGTAGAWIVIRAEGRATIRSTSGCCNLVQMSNVHYIRFSGFELTMRDTNAGIDGVNFKGSHNSYIVLDSLYIHGMTNVGIGMWPDSTDHVTLINSEIADNTGSGLYWGYPGRNIIHDVLIAHNYIHNCPRDPQQDTHYGIQFKGWCYRAVIRDNVLHDVGGVTRCGIVVYYGKKPLAGDDPADVNIVRGNVLWNCRNEGITAMSDALIENNIVFDAGVGINLQTYGDESFTGQNYVENLTVCNNTVFRCRTSCIAVSGWNATSVGSGVSLTANAAYQDQPGKAAISGSAGPAVVRGNVFFGTNSMAGGATAGNGLADFVRVSAAAVVPNLDFYPAASSPLLDLTNDTTAFAPVDFDGTARPQNGKADAGAYERSGAANPGWVIVQGFKEKGGSPFVLRPTGGMSVKAAGCERWVRRIGCVMRQVGTCFGIDGSCRHGSSKPGVVLVRR